MTSATVRLIEGVRLIQVSLYSAFFQVPVPKGWYSSYPGHSCKDIYDSGDARGDGEYWIDPEKNGNPLKVFCDMTRAGGEYWCSMVITERTYTLRSGYKMDDRGPGHPDPEKRKGPGLQKNFFLAHRASVSSKVRRGEGEGRSRVPRAPPPGSATALLLRACLHGVGDPGLVGLVYFVFTPWGTQNKTNLPH